ncbi:hypothetical protein [Aquiflexum sp.]|uniref:hypothetical protein n=1 Tax=Aquiflexum sp. TaxID=1872584 RepID=UPI00359431E9
MFLIIGIQECLAQDIFPPPVTKKSVQAIHINGEIKIDGKLEESEWDLAQLLPISFALNV